MSAGRPGAPADQEDEAQEAAGPVSEERWRLLDKVDFLERSLEDAGREHEVGDLSDEDHALLVRRDTERLAKVTAELAALDAADRTAETDQRAAEPEDDDEGEGAGADGAAVPGASTRRRRRKWLAVVGAALVAAGAVVLVVSLAAPRLPGQPETGSIKLNGDQLIRQQLTQADTLVTTNNLVGALRLYREVLGEDPDQPEALAESGWLEYEAGVQSGEAKLVAEGRTSVTRAEALSPGLAGPHLFIGVIELQQDGDAAAAVAEFRSFLADHPSAADVDNAAPFLRQAFAQAGQPLPAGVPAGSG